MGTGIIQASVTDVLYNNDLGPYGNILWPEKQVAEIMFQEKTGRSARNKFIQANGLETVGNIQRQFFSRVRCTGIEQTGIGHFSPNPTRFEL